MKGTQEGFLSPVFHLSYSGDDSRAAAQRGGSGGKQAGSVEDLIPCENKRNFWEIFGGVSKKTADLRKFVDKGQC